MFFLLRLAGIILLRKGHFMMMRLSETLEIFYWTNIEILLVVVLLKFMPKGIKTAWALVAMIWHLKQAWVTTL